MQDKQLLKNVKIMKNTENNKQDMLKEYNFDYSKAKPNRFIKQKDTKKSFTIPIKLT